MKADWSIKLALAVIATALSAIAIEPLLIPHVVEAQSADAYPLYFEPGTSMLRAPDGSRQVWGKVAIDRRTGNVWGFPTMTQEVYPIDNTTTTAPTSHPFLLGKFALQDTAK